MHAAGDQIVARTFGRGARHERRFDFEEALRGEVVADRLRDFVAHLDVGLHLVAAQVDVAILQAHFFVGKNCLAGKKRRRLRFVQDAQFFGDQLDFAGRDVLIDGLGIALLDVADDGDHIFIAQCRGFFVRRRIHSRFRTTWVTPVRSRRSMKMRLPRSRRRLTHPMSTAFFPASDGARAPHICVRFRSPKKSSKLCLSDWDCWESGKAKL